jgi:hypothetical protein
MRRPVLQLSRECRLVFLTAGGERNDPLVREVLAGEISWERVVALATQHKAIASLGRTLRRVGAGSTADEARERIRIQSMVSDFHMQHLQKRLTETLKSFSATDVPVMLLKGAALGSCVYSSFRDRPMADIDVLVREDDALLATIAAQKAEWIAEPDPGRVDLYDSHHHLPPFRDGRGSGHRLEIHTQPFPPPHPFTAAGEELWRDSRDAGAALFGARVPSREHMLIYACIHFAWSHMISGGAWRTFRDVSALCDEHVDWNAFVSTAKRWKAASSCYWTMRLAGVLCGIAAPVDVIESLRPPQPRQLSAMLERHFVSRIVPGERQSCPSVRANNLLWRAAIRPQWSGHPKETVRGDNTRWMLLARPERSSSGWRSVVTEARQWRRYLAGLLSAGMSSPVRLRPTPPLASPRIPDVRDW